MPNTTAQTSRPCPRSWSFDQEEGEYRDYVLYLPDVGGHGGRLRLTLNTQERSAYMVLSLDNVDGDDNGEATLDAVPLAWALAVAGGTDGFTLAEH
jgi:hypothetical protein